MNIFKIAIFIILTTILELQAAEPAPLTHGLTSINPVINSPALKLPNMDEEIIDIKALKGKVIVVNFWATWCPPCRREMTSLEKLHLATKDKNVQVLAVNIGEDIEAVFPFINSIDPVPSFPMLFDSNANSMKTWKIQGLPTTYIIDTQGNIAYKAIGGREFDHPDILNKVIGLSQHKNKQGNSK